MLTKGIFKRKAFQTELKSIGVFFLLVFTLTGCAGKFSEKIVGGPCKYKSYDGVARIVSLEPAQKNPADDILRVKVKFIFLPEKIIEEAFFRPEKRYVMYDNSLKYPSRQFVNKNHLKVNDTISARVKVISQGSCSPIEFSFPDLIY